jgi:hypothetical protein
MMSEAMSLGGKRMTQSQSTNLLGKVMRVAAHDWGHEPGHRHGTAARACSVVTGAARALLLEHLGAGARATSERPSAL